MDDNNVYFGRQKTFSEYATDAIQDAYERKLNAVIDERGTKKSKSVKEEINEMVCSDRGRRKRKGYFKR